MSAPDDRLIGVIGVQVQAAPRKNPGENVARSGDSLSRGAPDGYRKRMLHPSPLQSNYESNCGYDAKLLRPRQKLEPRDPAQRGIGGRTDSETAGPEQG